MTRISEGNMKLNKVPNVSLPPIKSCREDAPCTKYCYALKNYRMFPSVRQSWDHNWILLKVDRAKYFAGIDQYLKKKEPDMFRWHVAGDIVDSDYLSGMITIATRNPDTKFLAFTKMYHLLYRRRIPKNLQIVFSAWPYFPLPKQRRFPIAFMQDGTEKRVYNAIECYGNCEDCGMCWSLSEMKKNVVFNKH